MFLEHQKSMANELFNGKKIKDGIRDGDFKDVDLQ
jgi:hypothetical protein